MKTIIKYFMYFCLLILAACNKDSNENKISRIEISADGIELMPGKTFQLSTTIYPEHISDIEFMWSSSDSQVATVNENGLVTAVSPGSADISVSADGLMSVCRVNVISKSGLNNIDSEFIAGQAIYKGADPGFPYLGWVQLEIYDAEPDPVTSIIEGNLVKCKLHIPLPDPLAETFEMPSGTWEILAEQDEFVAEPGVDNGTDIPTGSYVVTTRGNDMFLGMLNKGTITITPDMHVQISLETEDGVNVKGVLNKPLEILNLGGGELKERYSSLTEDKVVDFKGAKTAYFLDYGDYWKNGTRNVILQIIDSDSMEAAFIEMTLPKADRWSSIPDCTLNVNPTPEINPAEKTFEPGISWQGNCFGTWGYIKLKNGPNDTVMPDLTNCGNGVNGTVSISSENNVYTVTLDLIDDAENPNRITGSWTGTLTPYEYPGSTSLSASRFVFPYCKKR